MTNWNFSKKKSINVSSSSIQSSIADYDPQPETRYKVNCTQCDFEYYTNRLPEAKIQSLNHDEKNNHYSEIEFLKGVAVF